MPLFDRTVWEEDFMQDIICQQPYHPAAQDWLPTEAKQGWAWLVPEWETSWEN